MESPLVEITDHPSSVETDCAGPEQVDVEQGAPDSQSTPESTLASTLAELEKIRGRLKSSNRKSKPEDAHPDAHDQPPVSEKLLSHHKDVSEEPARPSTCKQKKQPDSFDAEKIIQSLQGIRNQVSTLPKERPALPFELQTPFWNAVVDCIQRGEDGCFKEFCSVLSALLSENLLAKEDEEQIRNALKLCIKSGEVACLKVFCESDMLLPKVDHDCILLALRAGRHNKEIAGPVLTVMSEGEDTKEDHKLTLMYSGDVRTMMGDCDRKHYLRSDFEATCYSWVEKNILHSLDAACNVYKMRPGLRCSTDVLRALAEVPGQSTWQTLAARGVIAHAWNNAFPLFCCDMVLCAFRLWLLVWLTYKMHHLQFPPLAIWGLCFFTTCDFILAVVNLGDTVCMALKQHDAGDTMRQAVKHHEADDAMRKAFRQHDAEDAVRMVPRLSRVHLYNLFCLMVVCFEGLACLMVSQGLRRGLQNRLTLATWVACKWLHFAWHLRGTRLVGKRMLPVVYALGDVAGFLIVCLFALIAAIHMYYVLGDKGSFDVLKFDFDVVYRLVVLQDFENDELHSTNRSLELGIQIFFYVVSASLSIILMNLLIGVLGNNYDRYADRGEELCMRGRAAILSKYLSFPLFKRMISLEGDSDDKKELRIIVAEKPMDTKVEEERSVRTVVEKEMEKMRSELNKMHAEMDQIRKLHAIADNPEGPQRRLEADIWRKLRHIIKGLPNVKDTKRGDKIGQELGLLQEDGNSDSGEEEDALPGGKSYKDRKGITSPHHC
eukprot:CAMPEP_0178400016 /NCGR_PEP_ID=MMETSP0689_2-20121128/15572_1 /TAXON_ID=160604 /ORGANISM="Amphidinium massartii, Strain CS-259" /LENGTH=774 /DNA_ID=CAMNT_0020020799 /DNA_START=68 /DNA_END=2392 /DNA_ORIENTATION=-